ncbi:hypothetical protein Taro_048252, partial [Colocasia esculenta]|nr:hypothetical protein [Colocasia esculenta]
LWLREVGMVFLLVRVSRGEKRELSLGMRIRVNSRPQHPRERADVWWSSMLCTRFEDGAMERVVRRERLSSTWRRRRLRRRGQQLRSRGRRERRRHISHRSVPRHWEVVRYLLGVPLVARRSVLIAGGHMVVRNVGSWQGMSTRSRIAPDFSREFNVERLQRQQQQQQHQRQGDQGDLEPQLECLR